MNVGVTGRDHHVLFTKCWDGTQGVVYASQALYQLSLVPSPKGEEKSALTVHWSVQDSAPGYVSKCYTPTVAGSLLKGYNPFYFDMTVSTVYYLGFYSFITHAHVSLGAWGVGSECGKRG